MLDGGANSDEVSYYNATSGVCGIGSDLLDGGDGIDTCVNGEDLFSCP